MTIEEFILHIRTLEKPNKAIAFFDINKYDDWINTHSMSYGLKHHKISGKKSEENVNSYIIGNSDLKLNCAQSVLSLSFIF